jgi:two-component sensor histidine kinase/CheY-like chemotaxis protein
MIEKQETVILIVDDDPVNLSVLNDYLNKKNYKVLVAEDGETALERVANLKPDLILLDLELPDMTGFEIAGRLKANGGTRDIPVIFLTVRDDAKDKVKGFDLGAVDYITKPIHLAEIGARVKTHLTIRNLQKSLEEKNLKLEQSIRLNELLIDSIPHPAMLIRRDRVIIAANRSARQSGAVLGGYCWRDFHHSNYIPEAHNIPPGGTECIFCRADEAFEKDEAVNAPEVEVFGKKWDIWWIPIEKDIYLHYAIDITGTKQVEEQLRTALAEKGVLLKEIHHRVKNNLQLIKSLLNLQSRRINNEETSAVLKEVKNRVNSIALIHEKLYQAADLTGIDFSGYIRTLIQHLHNSYPDRVSSIRLNSGKEKVFLEVGKAIPCALIINELITNAIKYAFPKEQKGEITVVLKITAGKQIFMSVADDGAGLPDSVDIHNPPGLGMQIVNALVNQLRGTLAVARDSGTKFTILFPATEKTRET